MNNIKIEIPEGFVIDTANSNLEKGDIKFKKAEKALPTKWEDIRKIEGFYAINGDIISKTQGPWSNNSGKILWPTKELAEASLALCQLVRLRDIYNDGWVPDYMYPSQKWLVFYNEEVVEVSSGWSSRCVLSFKTEELAKEFRDNFKDLIEQAKPLL